MRLVLIATLMAATAKADQLVITVYDRAHLTKPVAESVFANLRQIFRVAEIEIGLVMGDPAADEASLNMYTPAPLPGHELEAACAARRDIALEIAGETPPSLNRSVLGMAQPLARKGLNVTVFDNRISAVALRENRDHAALLSHAIAHEIGHVLLRTNTHDKRGLMSGVWTRHEYGPMMNAPLFFTRDQSREMRMNLAGTGCPNAQPSSLSTTVPSTSVNRNGRP